MNIYLDIDGVLLTKAGEPAEGVAGFLRRAVASHEVYWLTTHCKGDTGPVVAHLRHRLPQEAAGLLQGIKPTTWGFLKTDALDFSQDFLWFDDYLMDAEKAVLERHDSLHKLVSVDLRADPLQLEKLLQAA